VEVRLLGPVEVLTGDRQVALGSPKERTVLAALATDAGRVVGMDTLVDRVWGQRTPADPRPTLYVYIARIRRALREAAGGRQRVHRRSGGYLLDVDPSIVDANRFRGLVDQARGSGALADAERAAMLREALALWRGEALAGLPGDWAARVRDGWRRQRLDAVVAWAAAERAAGDPVAPLGPLADLVDEHPMDESLVAALMRALWAAGRQAEALRRYATLRARLADELGVDPATDLRRLHEAMLRHDPLPATPADLAVASGTISADFRQGYRRNTKIDRERERERGRGVPAQLPLGVAGFAARRAELAALDAAIVAAEDGSGGGVSTITGTAGVGKTALAVRWAQRVRHRFPDGQLYVNLRGFDPGGPAVGPDDAVRGLLDALGVPPARVPAGLAAGAGLYRSLLGGRRILVLLDNARDAAQVRPLLPGGPPAFAVVTSRNRLSSLVAIEGARAVPLDVLTAAESRELLAGRLGADRVAAEPAAVDDLIELTAGLPLALAVTAARAAGSPGTRLAGLASQARRTGALDAFRGGDAAADVRAVFSWSYRALPAGPARLFRLLGLLPGADATVAALASLAGVAPPQARPLIADLADAHLVAECLPDRFGPHDLIRLYATELGEGTDRAAVARLVDHYLSTAYAADRLLFPHRQPIPAQPPAPGVTPADLADRDEALAWFTAERPAIVAAVRQAARAGLPAHAWRLAWTALDFFDRWGHWADQAVTQEIALAAATALDDPVGRAHSHRGLGRAYGRLGRLDEAHAHLSRAAAEFGARGSRTGQARTHLSLAVVAERAGRHRWALRHAERALRLFRVAGAPAGEGNALNTVGWYHALLGEHERAVDCCRGALAVLETAGDRYGIAATWDSLGFAMHRLGSHGEAADAYGNAVDLYRRAGDRYGEADTLTRLGEARLAAGDPAGAGDAWRRARDLLAEAGDPTAAAVADRLRGLGSAGP
jgi:DNA-binding SARP family transcriptional activator/tetratricopeptide (TPR) repeat protein